MNSANWIGRLDAIPLTCKVMWYNPSIKTMINLSWANWIGRLGAIPLIGKVKEYRRTINKDNGQFELGLLDWSFGRHSFNYQCEWSIDDPSIKTMNNLMCANWIGRMGAIPLIGKVKEYTDEQSIKTMNTLNWAYWIGRLGAIPLITNVNGV